MRKDMTALKLKCTRVSADSDRPLLFVSSAIMRVKAVMQVYCVAEPFPNLKEFEIQFTGSALSTVTAYHTLWTHTPNFHWESEQRPYYSLYGKGKLFKCC
ncbi:hypothetical protein BaRGS_00014395 [Batillaria attramentaria]|uniref:Uncharacterized protein n=1 Tax=Batillaria attramentaria TaxID=370345 RepID=A0ABD0L5F4_9CAEN